METLIISDHARKRYLERVDKFHLWSNHPSPDQVLRNLWKISREMSEIEMWYYRVKAEDDTTYRITPKEIRPRIILVWRRGVIKTIFYRNT
jgi:hypothetical protein